MKPDAPSPSLRTGFLSPLLKADRKTVLWIALIAIFMWILVSDTVNGGKSLLLHLSLKRQVSLGQDDAEIETRLLRIVRHNRAIFDRIGSLTENRRRFEEKAGQVGEIFGRKLSLKICSPSGFERVGAGPSGHKRRLSGNDRTDFSRPARMEGSILPTGHRTPVL